MPNTERVELVGHLGADPLRIVPREEGHSSALQSGEISEEERQRNLAGVRQLVAGVLGR